MSQLEQPYIKNEMERSVLSSPESSWFILNAVSCFGNFHTDTDVH